MQEIQWQDPLHGGPQPQAEHTQLLLSRVCVCVCAGGDVHIEGE